MSSSEATGNTPRARVEVTTWTFHPQPPSAVDAALDQQADRCFTAARVLQWATAVVLLVAFPAVLDFGVVVPPPVLVVGAALTVGASIGAALWHQHLRRRTGVPVIPVLEDTLERTAAMMGSQQELFELSLGENATADFPHLDGEGLQQLQRSARAALKAQRKLSSKFIIYAELATQADRRGWEWLRNRHVRTIAGMVLRLTGQANNETAT